MLLPEDSIEALLFKEGLEEATGPTKTYAMKINDERVIGTVDGVEALKQMVYKNINTEPNYPIYANFGVKKADLFGEAKPYAYMEITRRIKEALELDDRIKEVHSFVYREDLSKRENLGFSFVVDSIYGEVDFEEVVKFG